MFGFDKRKFIYLVSLYNTVCTFEAPCVTFPNPFFSIAPERNYYSEFCVFLSLNFLYNVTTFNFMFAWFESFFLSMEW